MAHDPSSAPAPDPLPRRSASHVIERLRRAREQVQVGKRPVLAFDADGTIWRGDVGVDVFEALLAEEAIRPQAVPALEALAREVGLAPAGSAVSIARALYDSWEKKLSPACPEDKTFAMMAWIYAGFGEDELHAFARRVLSAARIAERIRAEVRKIVAWARSSDVEVLVVSASPRAPVIEGVAHMDVAPGSVLALTPRVENGVLLPELTGVFVYQEGKAKAVREARPDAAVLGAFGDSAYDAHLLRMSAVPVAIGPGPGLLREAANVPGLVELELG